MQAKELRQKTDSELQHLLDETRRKVHELAFKAATKQSKDVHELSNAKRDVARAITILRERANTN